ncbi:Tetratricopeptide repeat protein [Candidatus Koribacter versatilis Ellin345]|uniref:Tetratricopeptide repeat protein n=1 Tax=Koribacter versatilis (strain Ellin345) TaxID=204669 RepID=Q1IHP2_KORVE|nr:tetratricopeptide repeat protein [Candidatus Koribacter versatilis]ABF43608.1 Tetratricopeptide repeat protein [Candidatus Koribacter versatilis Ellin345]
MKKSFIYCSLFLSFVVSAAVAQDFEINGGQQQQTPAPQKAGKKSKGKAASSAPANGGSNEIGWGNSIEVGRLARAAQDALKHGNPAAAATYAQRAVQAAPQNSKLWLLLGYTSRLAGRNQESINAYNHAIQTDPKSLDAKSGLAQTYMKMGRTDEAKRLLAQVLAAGSTRQNDLLVAGELYLRTKDYQQGINYLQRADNLKPNAHAELLMAMGYMKMKQPQKAKQLLDMAKRRAPNNVEIFQAVATFYREDHDYKNAIATLNSAPRKTPALLADLGFTYELSGDKQSAAATYVKAANAAPKEIKFQLSAAQSLIQSGDKTKAQDFLKRAAAIDPNHYRLHAIRAGLAKSENRNDEAVKEYQLALSAMPKEGVPEGQLYPVLLRLNLSEALKDTGNTEAAKQQVEIAEQEISKINVEGPAKAEFLRVRASIKASGEDYAGAEADLKEAQKLDPDNQLITLQYANLLWKAGRKDESKQMYLGILQGDPKNRYALEALGYLARDVGDTAGAEHYFTALAQAYPDDYIAYLALGDLYTATRDFTRALAAYDKAHELAPNNAIVIANAANAAIEARQFPLAGRWIAMATGEMADEPHVLVEKERYLFHSGKYQEAAVAGQRALEKLPKDRNASVYLAYTYYNLGRYDDVLALSDKYDNIIPKEPNFPLLEGHVHRQSQLTDEAVQDYTRALERDPKMVEAYVNRGYALNDLQNAEQAAQDFHAALQLNPNNGTAHLGLSFSELQLHHGKEALAEAAAAEKIMGESGATHLATATAYRQQRLMAQAEKEYIAAIKFAPQDPKLHLALAETQYNERKYQQSLNTLADALTLDPNDPLIYAQMAHAHAELKHRDETLRYVTLAEQTGGEKSAILLDTGEALLTLGDRDGAMKRFERALDAPDADRVQARLAIARLMVHDGKNGDARQQVALAFAESRIGEASPVTPDDLVEAANIFLSINDFDLAQRYFVKAKDAGAADEVVAIGLANVALVRGNTNEAQVQLASVGDPAEQAQNYDYQLALGDMYRQQRNGQLALSAFARANQLSGADNTTAERALFETAGQEGMHINDKLSLLSDLDVHGIFDNATIYNLDRQIFGVVGSQQPIPPRSTTESLWTNGYRLHLNGLPLISGFFQLRNARGEFSVPSNALIVPTDTYDYNFNTAINPTLKMGFLRLDFNAGVQFTVRRDKDSPVVMNQNLFRQFVYLQSNSIGDWLQIRGEAYHEAGPFTDRDLSSRDVGTRLEFVVGRPWGRNALLTGYSARDIQYNPSIREFFTTSTYAGLQHTFGRERSLTVAALGEYIRSWRVQDDFYAIAQAIEPGGRITWQPNNRWKLDGNFAWGKGEGFALYDNVQSSFFISYVKPFRRSMTDAFGDVPVEYPLRFSLGVQTDNFYHFTGRGQTQIRPVIRLTLF